MTRDKGLGGIGRLKGLGGYCCRAMVHIHSIGEHLADLVGNVKT